MNAWACTSCADATHGSGSRERPSRPLSRLRALTAVALDCDVLRPGEIACFMPEPGGLDADEARRLLAGVAERAPVAGMGLWTRRSEPGAKDILTVDGV